MTLKQFRRQMRNKQINRFDLAACADTIETASRLYRLVHDDSIVPGEHLKAMLDGYEWRTSFAIYTVRDK